MKDNAFGAFGSAGVFLNRQHPSGSDIITESTDLFLREGIECARICRSTRDVSGIMGWGFETVSFPFRKPLIQKTARKREYGPRVLQKIAQGPAGCIGLIDRVGRRV